MKKVGSIIISGIAGLIFTSMPMYADIANGGFESGSFSGWTISGPSACVGSSLCGGNADDTDPGPHSGKFAAYLGSPGNLESQGESDNELGQTVATTAGQSYTLDFFLAVGSTARFGGALPNSFTLSWDGTTLASFSDLASQPYTEQSYTVTGTGSDTLLFNTAMFPSVFVLDDVSLTANIVSTPEPTSVILLLTMLLTVAFVVRKRIA